MRMREDAAEIIDEHRRAMADARRLMKETRSHWHGVRAEFDGIKSGLEVQLALLRRATAMPAWGDWSAPPQDAAASAAQARREAAIAAHTFSTVAALVAQAEAAALNNAASLDDLIRRIKALIRTNSEPGMLAGILLEGIAQTIGRLVPSAERPDFVAAVLAVLQDRVDPAPRTPA